MCFLALCWACGFMHCSLGGEVLLGEERDGGTVAGGCHSGVGRVLGSREHGGSEPGAGMNLRECLQPSVVCTLSCFRQELSKDPELPGEKG